MKSLILITSIFLILTILCKILFYKNNWPSIFDFNVILVVLMFFLVILFVIKLVR
jgi:hypothetical protein